MSAQNRIWEIRFLKGLSANQLLLLMGGIFVLPYVVWLIMGPDSYVLIHDNLDSEFVYNLLLLDSGKVLDMALDTRIEQVMNGLPRSFLRSGLSVTFIVFSLLPAFYAYLFHHFLVHLIGLAGMYLLLRKHFLKDELILVGVISLLWALLPYYHINYGISIAGQPLLLYAFLNLWKAETRWTNWAILIAFPFFSFMPVTLPFFIPFLILFFLFKRFWEKDTRNPLYFFLGMVVICVVNVLVEFPLFYSMIFSSEYVSHRSTWDIVQYTGLPSFGQFLADWKTNLTMTYFHAGTMSTLPILLAVGFLLFARSSITKPIKLLLFLILLIAALDSTNEFMVLHLGKIIELLVSFNTERFFFMAPLLWMLLFALVIQQLVAWKKAMAWVGLGLAALLALSMLRYNPEVVQNARILAGMEPKEPTFRNFFAHDIFDEIKKDIGKDPATYRIVSVGMYPSVTQANGFYTLDSYQNNYLLSYKNEFKEVIADEIAKDEALQTYFELWGSRCYIFSAELGRVYMFDKRKAKAIHELDINTQKLKEMGCEYLFSAMPIENHQELNLSLTGTYEEEGSFWKIYVYRLVAD